MSFQAEHGPSCAACGGRSTRAVRTRKLASVREPTYYLAYLWSCSVCGDRWVDDRLESCNASAEEAARMGARRAS